MQMIALCKTRCMFTKEKPLSISMLQWKINHLIFFWDQLTQCIVRTVKLQEKQAGSAVLRRRYILRDLGSAMIHC